MGVTTSERRRGNWALLSSRVVNSHSRVPSRLHPAREAQRHDRVGNGRIRQAGQAPFERRVPRVAEKFHVQPAVQRGHRRTCLQCRPQRPGGGGDVQVVLVGRLQAEGVDALLQFQQPLLGEFEVRRGRGR